MLIIILQPQGVSGQGSAGGAQDGQEVKSLGLGFRDQLKVHRMDRR
jgi:hypothetical protein